MKGIYNKEISENKIKEENMNKNFKGLSADKPTLVLCHTTQDVKKLVTFLSGYYPMLKPQLDTYFEEFESQKDFYNTGIIGVQILSNGISGIPVGSTTAEKFGYATITSDEFLKLNQKETINDKVETKDMKEQTELAQPVEKLQKAYRTRVISVNGVERNATVAVVRNTVTGVISAGYAIVHPDDIPKVKDNKELSRNIAVARALKDKTNLCKDDNLVITGDVERYILLSIADDVLKRIEKGKILIKGIREPRVKENTIEYRLKEEESRVYKVETKEKEGK